MQVNNLIETQRTPRPRSTNHDVVSEIYDLISSRTDGNYATRFLFHMQQIRTQLSMLDDESQCLALREYWINQLDLADVKVLRPRQAGKSICNRDQLKAFMVRFIINRIEELDLPRVADKPYIRLRG